ncbi:MAG: hypothetical protein C3L25_01915 [Candidatus Sedimenticola endophacoides]|uniref:Response regulatory domain-containing protein n=1 Tax=Candidatus Sedimenticola endophacoides TaxID=2548426 RepID=A0A6N4E092_9GAMM|nr:MAG: hypothetical protein C3L26_01920 [Candidatus Sedimenticola endophacoides]PUE03312.1 MAG: hypothetical protein C3L24_04805 [Candidatus Sedimenticola endophacoides]PUE05125.1 MAG: hypothetical protein C3L25_01915 [Candidatus Sedimenticola endophacoides]
MLPASRHPRIDTYENRRIAGYAGQRKTILVVDDEPANRALIIDHLTPLGFNVLEAHSAEFALQITRDFTIDLYLLDVFMPVTDGWKLADELRRRYPDTPIFMVSGNTYEERHDSHCPIPHNAYLIKPIQLDSLLAKIGNALRLKWLHQDRITPQQVSTMVATGDNIPSNEDVKDLVAMARIGYLTGILEKLGSLEVSGIDSGFLHELKTKADLCDFEGLIQQVQAINNGTR